MNEMIPYEYSGSLELKGCCKTFYAGKVGRTHIARGTVYQDNCLAENVRQDTHVVCLADGHGGAAYTRSDRGAYYACTVFVDMLKKSADTISSLSGPGFKNAFIKKWKEKVLEDYCESEDKRQDNDESEHQIILKYGTTFMFTVVCGDKLIVGQLGDGSILLVNKYGQHQPFRRHAAKTSSVTNSMASQRAEQAFLIDVYDKKYFSNVLLSTDGIYDRLDEGDAFYIYEQELECKIGGSDVPKEPFTVTDMDTPCDITNISTDDCTIAMISLYGENIPIVSAKIEMPAGYEEMEFYRFESGLAMFTEQNVGSDDVSHRDEIHIIEGVADESECELKTAKLIKAKEILGLDEGHTAFVYEIDDRWYRVGELIDRDEHLEKRYDRKDPDDEEDFDMEFSNEYWLRFYEGLLSLREEMSSLGLLAADHFKESLFITADLEIAVLSDAVKKNTQECDADEDCETVDCEVCETADCRDAPCGESIERVLDMFSIFGKLTCGEKTIPLFATEGQGQAIVMINNDGKSDENRELCRVVFDPEKGTGLWNRSGESWVTGSGRIVPANTVLKLDNKDQSFHTDDSEYLINLLRR